MGKAAAPKVCECYGPKQQNAPSSPATPVARERNPTPPIRRPPLGVFLS